MCCTLNFFMVCSFFQAPPSETSSDSESSTSDAEWLLFDDGMDWLTNKRILDQADPDYDVAPPANGLHWEFNGTIHTTSGEKMAPKSTTVKTGSEALFATPIQSMMTMFPLLF